jgi:hypothetical protein
VSGGAAVRVHWADEQLLSALHHHQQQQSACKHAKAAGGGNSTAGCTELPSVQVVVLGAAIDTRPWRLALPPGVSWFDCDHPTALAVKHTQLQQLGVPTWRPASPSSGDTGDSSQQQQPWLAWAVSCWKQLVWVLQLQQAALVARWKQDTALQQVTNCLRAKVRRSAEVKCCC